MIQNPVITEKLEQKTKSSPVLRQFIETVLANEAEGKNYKKLFEAEIDKSIEKRKKGQQ